MQAFIWIGILVFILLAAGAVTLGVIAIRRAGADTDLDQDTRPQGYYVSLGISIGAGFGVALGLVFDHLALGIAIGAAIGASLGGILEQRNKDRIRPLDMTENTMQNRGLTLGVIFALLGLVVLAGLVLLLIR